jgi:predicted GNAT family acetyltransferase
MEYVVSDNEVYFKDPDGNRLGEVTFPNINETTVEINRTYVSPIVRGQGIANVLMKKAADLIREKGYKVVATCSYAKAWFEKHPEYSDLLSV